VSASLLHVRAITRSAVAISMVATVMVFGGCARQAVPLKSTARTCIYSGSRLSDLIAFERRVGTHVSCALVYDTDQPTWSAWEDPWFISNRIPNENWIHFARRRGDRLIITVEMFPEQAKSQSWRVLGAEGSFAGYARTLATNLVANGMGDAVIRIGPEANGTWAEDNIGTAPKDWALWRRFWRRTALAMRSVRGAHFDFNWCIAAGYRPIPFADYYPGDDVVDSVGVDVYDEGEPRGEQNSWGYQDSRPGGVAAIAAFAKAHHKPFSIPEWGLEPTADGGGGNRARFIKGVKQAIHSDNVLFESYFFVEDSKTALEQSPASLALYRGMIGAR
jgi:hypothetical protein